MAIKSEIVSLKFEHQNEIHILKRSISVDFFGWHVELDQRCVKSLLDAMAMNHCKSIGSAGTSRVPIRCWNLSICEEQRFDIAFSTKEIMREAAGPTTASKTKLKRTARYLKGCPRCGLEIQRQGAPRLVECWQAVRASQFDIRL